MVVNQHDFGTFTNSSGKVANNPLRQHE